MAEPWTDNDVITAAQLANMPWGVMGYVNGSTSNQAGITTVVDVTSLTVTFTAVSTRLYQCHVVLYAQQLTATSNPTIFITDGAGTQVDQTAFTIAANEYATFTCMTLETGLSGSTTRKVRIQTSSGTLTVQGAATYRPRFIVADVGAG